MSRPKKPQNNREITYQVGWKKGTIKQKANMEPDPPTRKVDYASYIWRKAPLLPSSFDLYVVYALPIISIFAIAMLIHFLNQI
jgi:hypothetical protein